MNKFDAKEEAIKQLQEFLPYGIELGVSRPTDPTFHDMSEYHERSKPLREDYWKRLKEINRALNWTVLNGPFPAEYWTDVEPLDHYKWEGDDKAVDDLREMLEKLPSTIYYDEDGCVYTSDPYMDSDNWEDDPDEGSEDDEWVENAGEPTYIGPENYTEISATKLLLHKEVCDTFFGY